MPMPDFDDYEDSYCSDGEREEKPVMVRKPTVSYKTSDEEKKDSSPIPPLPRVPSIIEIGDQRLYEVTLDSSSSLGTYSSIGKALIVKLDEFSYELKAVLNPQNVPFYARLYAISQPYYVHAIVKTNSDSEGKATLDCTGYAQITKALVTVTLPANHVKVALDKPLTSHTNKYEFSLNPLTLFGMSPGKTTNTGKLVLLSKTVDDVSTEELAPCDKIDIEKERIIKRI